MKKFALALSSLYLLSSLPALAQPPSSYRKPQKTISAKPQQIPFSFIAPSQPSPTLARMQTQLIGRVVEQAQPPANPPQPRYVQIFLTQEELAALETPKPLQTTTTPTMRHSARRKFHFDSKRPKKLRVQPEVITDANSYVVPITSADAGQLCGLIASFIQEQIPDTQTNLLLTDIPVSQTGNMLTVNLHHTLKSLGYTLVQTQETNPVSIRYRVSNLGKALLVRVKVNGVETARLYERSFSGALAAASPTSRINRSEP